MWHWVNLKFACGGIRTTDEIIVETPPIWRGWIGKNIVSFYQYYKNRGELIEIRQIS